MIPRSINFSMVRVAAQVSYFLFTFCQYDVKSFSLDFETRLILKATQKCEALENPAVCQPGLTVAKARRARLGSSSSPSNAGDVGTLQVCISYRFEGDKT
jgi:hypothetical protein